MIEPTSQATTAVATIAAGGVTLPLLATAPNVVPQLMVFGIALGLRADVLVAGFGGALVAIAFFNTVPGGSDTLSELFRTTLRRMGYALASAVTAGYLTPLVMLMEGANLRIPESLMLGVAFVIGASAQRSLARFIKKESVLPPAGGAANGGGNVAS
jgi:hypothetical protein